METIDARGLICPVPVIEAKKAIEKLPKSGGIIRILVDNLVACENLGKMCGQKGYQCAIDKRADKDYAVDITVGEDKEGRSNLSTNSGAHGQNTATVQTISNGGGLTVAIGQDKMGSGDDDLGRILIKGFIYSLANLDVPPAALVFFNSGIKLTLKDSNTLDDLKTLKQRGTTILVCGTCADFFQSKDLVAVGEITNMYGIVEVLSRAGNTINI